MKSLVSTTATADRHSPKLATANSDQEGKERAKKNQRLPRCEETKIGAQVGKLLDQ